MRSADPEESIQDMVAKTFHRWLLHVTVLLVWLHALCQPRICVCLHRHMCRLY
jgi:hypothetical protein